MLPLGCSHDENGGREASPESCNRGAHQPASWDELALAPFTEESILPGIVSRGGNATPDPDPDPDPDPTPYMLWEALTGSRDGGAMAKVDSEMMARGV